MATATITLKKGTTAEWTESKRVLDDGELGPETRQAVTESSESVTVRPSS